MPLVARSTIRARSANPCDTVRPRSYLSSVIRSSSVSVSGAFGLPFFLIVAITV